MGKRNTGYLQPFLRSLARLGFALHSLDNSNQMFVSMVLRKMNVPTQPPATIQWPQLRACMYKKR